MLLGEISVRVLYQLKRRREGKRPKYLLYTPVQWNNADSKTAAYAEHPQISYVKRANNTSTRYPSNNLGYSGRREIMLEKEPGTIRIFVAGDSTVESNDIDQKAPFDPELTWPRVMESELNRLSNGNIKFEVINAAVLGYSSIESLADFQLRGIYLKPDFVIIHHNINEAWYSQACADFKPDSSHCRIAVHFPKISPLPDIKISYLYQYAKKRFARYEDAMLPYIVNEIPFKSDPAPTLEKQQGFENNLRAFCAIAKLHGIVPILMPWNFIPGAVTTPFGHNFNPAQLNQFIELLNQNNRSTQKISQEFSESHWIDPGKFERHHFRDHDWIHWSRGGLIEMGERMALEFSRMLDSRH